VPWGVPHDTEDVKIRGQKGVRGRVPFWTQQRN
jgi:hypothetical protein